MAPYVPTDDPQKFGMAQGGDAKDLHETELRKYGPVPPNWSADRVQRKDKATNSWEYFMRYKVNPNNRTGQPEHPLSPEGLQKKPNPHIQDESDLNRPSFPGIVDVPIKYKTSPNIKWRHSVNWKGALAAAMACLKQSSIYSSDGFVTEADVQTTLDKLDAKMKADPRNYKLYHPSDRKSLVFKEEPDVAMVAREYGFRLVLFCPFVDADKTGWNRFYNITNRPPIYARWSTGPQAAGPPVVLGCLPRQNPTSSTPKPFDVMWFSIDVRSAFRPVWHVELYENADFKPLATAMGFPVDRFLPQVFLCCLVYLHRSLLLEGAIPDSELPCWIWQFSKHLLVSCKPAGRLVPFHFNPAKLPEYKSKYPKAVNSLTYARLTRWTMNPNMRFNQFSVLKYASQWDEAIEARMVYEMSHNDKNWLTWVAKMEAVRKLPF